MQTQGWKRCPGQINQSLFKLETAYLRTIGCQTPVQKISGCNHMTVSPLSRMTPRDLTLLFLLVVYRTGVWHVRIDLSKVNKIVILINVTSPGISAMPVAAASLQAEGRCSVDVDVDGKEWQCVQYD